MLTKWEGNDTTLKVIIRMRVAVMNVGWGHLRGWTLTTMRSCYSLTVGLTAFGVVKAVSELSEEVCRPYSLLHSILLSVFKITEWESLAWLCWDRSVATRDGVVIAVTLTFGWWLEVLRTLPWDSKLLWFPIWAAVTPSECYFDVNDWYFWAKRILSFVLYAECCCPEEKFSMKLFKNQFVSLTVSYHLSRRLYLREMLIIVLPSSLSCRHTFAVMN
jgi:hypothetical protein